MTADECEACGTEVEPDDRGFTVCPHCDDVHQCQTGNPTCQRFSVWYGRPRPKA